jgi:hypothetical protein
MPTNTRFKKNKKALKGNAIKAYKNKWWSHQDSNLDLEFRKLLFYPLNYETD